MASGASIWNPHVQLWGPASGPPQRSTFRPGPGPHDTVHLRKPVISDMEHGSPPGQTRVAVIGTVAGGLGDVSFVANLIASVVRDRSVTVDVVVCQQAGGDAATSLQRLCTLLGESGTPSCALGVAYCTYRQPGGSCGRDFFDIGGHAKSPTGPPLSVAPSLFLQGPLALFDSAGGAMAALVAADSPSHSAPPRLVTVREFGQGAFCAAAREGALDVDTSAGFAEGEIGIFRLYSPKLALATTLGPSGCGHESRCGPVAISRPRFVVGYFRSRAHYKNFGRLAASVLLPLPTERKQIGADLGDCRSAVVFGPWNNADSDLADSTQRFAEALREHPSVSSVNVDLSDAIRSEHDCGLMPPPWAAGIGVDPPPGGLWEDVATVITVLTAGGVRIALRLVSLPALSLTAVAFRCLLSHADAAVVTGDASLNEVICYGVPFWYSCEPHKVATRAALLRLVAAPARSAAFVKAWWSLVDGPPRGMPVGDAADDRYAAWATLAQASEGSDTAAPPAQISTSEVLRHAFRDLWENSAAPVAGCGLKYIDDTLGVSGWL